MGRGRGIDHYTLDGVGGIPNPVPAPRGGGLVVPSPKCNLFLLCGVFRTDDAILVPITILGHSVKHIS